jgi:general transcription factor 3C polypeptide 3 (transcription factor C subunit 4)
MGTSTFKQHEQAMQFYLIAAHLSPKECHLWNQLAHMSLQFHKPDQAQYCMGKAVRANPTDDTMLTEYLQMVKSSPSSASLNSLRAVLTLRPHDVTLATTLAQLYHDNGDLANALKVLEKVYDYNDPQGDLNIANIMAELFLDLKKYDECAQV